MHRPAVAALLAVVLAVAGCRGAESREPVDRDDPLAACKIFTPAEISSVVNIPPENNEISSSVWRGNPPIRNLPGVTFCRYNDTQGTFDLFVGVSTFSREAKEFARRAFEKWRQDTDAALKQSDRALEPVQGLGQQAVWNGGPSDGYLVVLDGDGILTISLGRQQPALERAKKLAAKGLKRI